MTTIIIQLPLAGAGYPLPRGKKAFIFAQIYCQVSESCTHGALSIQRGLAFSIPSVQKEDLFLIHTKTLYGA